MTHRFSGRRLLAVLPIAILLAAFTGAAHGATTSDGQTSATFGPGKNNATFSGQLNFDNSPPPVTFTPGDPCPPGFSDMPPPATNGVVCEHFTVTAAVKGSFDVCVTAERLVSDPLASGPPDVDVYVVAPPPSPTNAGTVVIAGTTSPTAANAAGTKASPECVSFQATAGQSLELQINPFSLGCVLITPCTTAITGQVNFTADKITASGSCFKGRHMQGHGKDEHNGHHREHHGKFEDDNQGGRHDHDKYTYKDEDEGYSFRATQFDVVNVTPTLDLLGNPIGGVTHAEGWGVDNSGQTVPFVLDLVDGGATGPDTYALSVGDGYSATGSLSSGKNAYYDDGIDW
jgi:hypothetical protein